MIERKRRRFEIDWEGAPEDLRSRVLASDNYATARCRLILIRAIRRDLPLKFKQLLELQMKIKYEEYDDATTYLHEVMMDDRDFILKVIELIADEYKQRGIQYIEGFRCLFQNYKLDQEVALFRRAADCNPKRTSEILLALQAMRPEAFNTVSVFLMDALRKGSEPPHGLATFGNSLMFIGHNVLLALSTLFSKLSPLSSEFTQVANLIGPSEVYRLVGLSYIYSRQYSMCIGYCTTVKTLLLFFDFSSLSK
uniref:RPN1_RPN2_N domain-containing protein n=1 Tax=Heterorhabditis bacteriophora TaxID=37862 RepID=A0A1I7WY37_HETBA